MAGPRIEELQGHIGTDRIYGGVKPPERSEKHDHLIEIFAQILPDVVESVFLIVSDELVGTIDADDSASDDLLSFSDLIDGLIDEGLSESRITFGSGELTQQIRLSDIILRPVELPEHGFG